MNADLLPSNRTVHEEALAVATDPGGPVLAAIEPVRGFRYQRPLDATVAPWLVLEYGLGPIADFFGTVEDLIDEGRAWQRIRGTPAALEQSLGWIDYDSITIEDQAANRRRWHLYQLGMGELPCEDEVSRLADAEYLAGLSDPARSELFRGFHGHDIRGLALGNGRFGGALLGDSSGVRIGGGVKWSHGRTHILNETDIISDWGPFGWEDAFSEAGYWSGTLPWDTPGLSWDGAASEIAIKTWLLLQKPAHVGFYDAAGQAIGYSRVIRDPIDNSGTTGAVSAIYTVRTGFGDGYGKSAASAAVVYGIQAEVGVKPFKSWLEPDEAIAGTGIAVGMADFAHTFQQTVRETVVFTLTIEQIEIVPMLFGSPAFRLG